MILLLNRAFPTRPGGILVNLDKLWHGSTAVLFDFDGVLADSEPFYRKSWNLVLSAFQHSVPEDVYWKHWSYLGEGLKGEMERTGLNISSPEKEKERQRGIYRDFCLAGRIPLFPLAADVIDAVMKQKPCAIASNTNSELVRRVAGSEMAILPPVIGGEGLRSKPAPDIFLRAAETLGVNPENCLVFEDAMKGIKAGNAAGMKVVLVRNRYNKDFDATGAALEIQGLYEIIQVAGGS